ncbi:MAG: SO2930 family diheme c-type cytochrome [Chitinophagales bacterium]
MKKVIRYTLVLFVPVAIIAYGISCNTKKAANVVLDVAANPFEKLSDYNFFTGTLNQLKPNARVIPYDLITPLFTDYAFKARFIYVPEGKSIDYDTSQVLQLPVGACLIKNFYYPEDFRKPEGERRIIETRLLIHREEGWDNLDYIWNEEQTEALLENTGAIKQVSWTHFDGSKKEIEYVVPNKNQCKSCHWRNDKSFSPIGPKVRNLNRDYAYAEGTENQLAHWSKLGILKNAPAPDAAPRLADWKDSTHYNVNERARAYLEMNCGHCHNPNGPAYTSGLFLNVGNMVPDNLGICKVPVAAGKATGGLSFDIMPAYPDSSILIHRVASTDPAVKMPELGRVMVHAEGLELLTKWIAQMPANHCIAQ